jgi:hypothetical protein
MVPPKMWWYFLKGARSVPKFFLQKNGKNVLKQNWNEREGKWYFKEGC